MKVQYVAEKDDCVAILLGLFLVFTLSSSAWGQFSVAANGKGTVTITGYDGSDTEVSVPGTIDGMNVTAIGDGAFFFKGLTRVSIPNGVRRIGNFAFSSCDSLTSVALPESLNDIGDQAFAFCDSLTSVTIPDSVTNIGIGAFAECGRLTNAVISTNAASIGDAVFYNCRALPRIAIPDNVTHIDCFAFGYCGLTNVSIPRSVTRIGHSAFFGCGNLTDVAFPECLAGIGDGAFAYCGSLTRIATPVSVTQIESSAFECNPNLQAVYFTGNAPTAGADLFSGTPATIYYLPGAAGWGLSFNGRPALLWNPQIEAAGRDSIGQIFSITGTAGIPILVEACTNLAEPVWVPQLSGTLTNGLVFFSDPALSGARFYRVRSP